MDSEPPRGLEDQPLMRVLSDIASKRDSEKAMIIVAHAFIEQLVTQVAKAKLRHGSQIAGDRRGFPHSTKLLLLRETGHLSDEQFSLLNWFRNVRNKVVHEPEYEVTDEVIRVQLGSDPHAG